MSEQGKFLCVGYKKKIATQQAQKSGLEMKKTFLCIVEMSDASCSTRIIHSIHQKTHRVDNSSKPWLMIAIHLEWLWNRNSHSRWIEIILLKLTTMKEYGLSLNPTIVDLDCRWSGGMIKKEAGVYIVSIVICMLNERMMIIDVVVSVMSLFLSSATSD